MNQKNFYVYGHYTKDTKELFYIGVGRGPRAFAKSSRNNYWKNIVNKHGYETKMMLVGFKNREQAVKYEIILQKFHNPKTCLVYGDTSNRVVSQETRKRMSDAKIGKRYALGAIRSEETRKKMGDAKIGNTHTKGFKHTTVYCPHCPKSGGKPAMTRWHFDNCKNYKDIL